MESLDVGGPVSDSAMLRYGVSLMSNLGGSIVQLVIQLDCLHILVLQSHFNLVINDRLDRI